MSTIISSPDITGIDKLYEYYKTSTYYNSSVINIDQFYIFLSENSQNRQLFLDEYCDYSFISLDGIVILKLKPKE